MEKILDGDRSRRKQLRNQYRAEANQQRETMARLKSEREEHAWDVLRQYLAEATSSQRHIYAAQSNYDGNRRALEFLVADPKTDQATAVLIFWMLGADYFLRVSEEEVRDFQRGSNALIWTIERRVREGFYQATTLKFDPWTSCVPPGEYERLGPVQRAVSELMYQATDGEAVVFDDLERFDEGLPEAVIEAIREIGANG
ncbi:DUF4274 domain-containing protein [Ottowia thiooxydans]|uniref:DUF4274 domain-containing protein n=1 Tax=Ottowia thiooxydans TaxID=219182 RepID=UPI00146E4B0D|nr:DUF4274 domain-containing protein [Ottowia thiooxydans]